MRGRNVIYIINEKIHAVLLIASFNDRFLVQQFFFPKEMSRDTIIRWRLINEKTQRKNQVYKEGNGVPG